MAEGAGTKNQCGLCGDAGTDLAAPGLDQRTFAGQGVHSFKREQSPPSRPAVYPQGAVERGNRQSQCLFDRAKARLSEHLKGITGEPGKSRHVVYAAMCRLFCFLASVLRSFL